MLVQVQCTSILRTLLFISLTREVGMLRRLVPRDLTATVILTLSFSATRIECSLQFVTFLRSSAMFQDYIPALPSVLGVPNWLLGVGGP